MAIAKRNLNLDQNPNLKPRKKVWEGPIDFPKTTNISNDPETILVGDLLVWKGQPLSQDYLRTIDEDMRDEIAKDVFNFAWEYDWNKLRFKESDIKKAWSSVCKFETKTEKREDGITYVSNSSTSGNKVYRSYFPNILKVAGVGRPSIYETLTNRETLWKVIRNRIGNTLIFNDNPNGVGVQYPMNLSISQLTIGSKNSGQSSFGSIFKPTVAKAIYEAYVKDGDKVLDYSSGFAGRLLGLMSIKRNNLYCGYEPNIETYSGLVKMSSDFGFNSEIKCSGSETDDLFDHKFDFCFSSPPYGCQEFYSSEPTQANIKYPDYNDFLEKYWRKTVQNCKSMLKDDGIFSINIGGEANELMRMFEADYNRIIVEEGFDLVDRWNMVTSKSHLTDKKGKSDKTSKLEGIFFYKKL